MYYYGNNGYYGGYGYQNPCSTYVGTTAGYGYGYGAAMSLCTVANFGFNFLVVFSFLPLIHRIGEACTFWMFGAVSLLCIFFVYFCVPETKGISLETIEKNWIDGVPPRKF